VLLGADQSPGESRCARDFCRPGSSTPRFGHSGETRMVAGFGFPSIASHSTYTSGFLSAFTPPSSQ